MHSKASFWILGKLLETVYLYDFKVWPTMGLTWVSHLARPIDVNDLTVARLILWP